MLSAQLITVSGGPRISNAIRTPSNRTLTKIGRCSASISFSSKSVRVRRASRPRTPHSSSSTSLAKATEAPTTISARIAGCLNRSGIQESSVSTAVTASLSA